MGTELYVGRHGYWHAGAAVTAPLGEKLAMVLGTHLVCEENGAREVPSFEAELIRQFSNGLEMEAFAFGYTQVEQKQAWGFGLRATRQFELPGGVKLAPFFGSTYARVSAMNELTDAPVSVAHLMLIAGLTAKYGPLSFTVIGSHSLYNCDPSGLETPVDLESMTHFAAYENNDGFARSTAAAEVAYEVSKAITLHVRYAAMRFDEETRHAIAFTPTIKFGEKVQLTGGVQLLRGGEVENDLVFAGMSLSF